MSPETQIETRMREAERSIATHDEKHRVTDAWLREVADDVRAIREQLSGTAGGLRALLLVGSFVGGVAAIGGSLGALWAWARGHI